MMATGMDRFFEVFLELLPIPLGLALSSLMVAEVWAWNSRNVRRSLSCEQSDVGYLLPRVRAWDDALLGLCGVLATLTTAGKARQFVPVAVSLGLLAFFAMLGAPLWMLLRSRKSPKPLVVPSGILFDRVEQLRRRIGVAKSFNIWLFPEGFREKPRLFCEFSDDRVWMPQRLLAWMSRAEIDALFGWVVVRSGERDARKRVYWLAAAAGFAAALTLRLLDVSVRGCWVTFLVLLLVEVAALQFLKPRLLRWGVLHPAEIGCDREALGSALLELDRMEGRAVDVKLVEKVALQAGITAERLWALQRQPRPASDRYPSFEEFVEVVL